jgi:hypothetical protein
MRTPSKTVDSKSIEDQQTTTKEPHRSAKKIFEKITVVLVAKWLQA